jgi:hypothetical protein
MSREQELARELAAWLAEGPTSAPTSVVDAALERIAGQGQRPRLLAWLRTPPGLDRPVASAGVRAARWLVLALLLAVLLATLLVIGTPFGGSPMPTLAPDVVLSLKGIASAGRTRDVADATAIDFELSLDDPRASGQAWSLQRVEDAPATGMQRVTGLLRIENGGGAWQGEVLGVRYPEGLELVFGWLSGEGGYQGFSCFIHLTVTPDGRERTVEAVVWPGEPPAVPAQELLPTVIRNIERQGGS